MFYFADKLWIKCTHTVKDPFLGLLFWNSDLFWPCPGQTGYKILLCPIFSIKLIPLTWQLQLDRLQVQWYLGVVELVRRRVRTVSVYPLITDVMEILTAQTEATKLIVVSKYSLSDLSAGSWVNPRYLTGGASAGSELPVYACLLPNCGNF